MEKNISKTKIKSRIRKKTNPILIDTIREASKNKEWFKVAKKLASSNSNYSSLNLSQIDKESSEGDTIVIPGKVLSEGDITKKLKICALSISESALKKLKESKSEFVPLIDEIKSNKKAEGIKILE